MGMGGNKKGILSTSPTNIFCPIPQFLLYFFFINRNKLKKDISQVALHTISLLNIKYPEEVNSFFSCASFRLHHLAFMT